MRSGIAKFERATKFLLRFIIAAKVRTTKVLTDKIKCQSNCDSSKPGFDYSVKYLPRKLREMWEFK